jgi:hypothetical protein
MSQKAQTELPKSAMLTQLIKLRLVTPGFRRVRVIYAVVFFSLLFSSVLNVESL